MPENVTAFAPEATQCRAVSASCCQCLLLLKVFALAHDHSDDGYLGFFNRTCGALPPKSVGPVLRSESVVTWRQWRVVLVDERESEQWGYMETYYPEEWGQARYAMFSFPECSFLLYRVASLVHPLLHLAVLVLGADEFISDNRLLRASHKMSQKLHLCVCNTIALRFKWLFCLFVRRGGRS